MQTTQLSKSFAVKKILSILILSSVFIHPSFAQNYEDYEDAQMEQIPEGKVVYTDPSKPNQQDVNYAMNQFFSLTPDQIITLRQKADIRTEAGSTLPFEEPKPSTGSISVSLAPGSQPPVIRPFLNNTSIFTVIDSSGSPWPVENFIVGDDDSFSVTRFDLDKNGSSFAIVPKKMYGKTNLALKLKDQETPVIINLMSGQDVLDSRVEVRVQGVGPNAIISSGSMIEGTDARLLPILDGVPPENGKSLKVSGQEQTRAWAIGNKFIVRTPLKIISPASNSFISSAEGNMNVYVLTQVAQFRGINKENKIITVNLGGY